MVGSFKHLTLPTRSDLEQSAIEGDSPVSERKEGVDEFKSSAHWILNANIGDINF